MESLRNERFNELLTFLKKEGIIHNQVNFGNKIGIGKGFVTDLKNGNKTISEQMVLKIKEYILPTLNPEWLLTGKGSMLLSEKELSASSEETSEEEQLNMVPLIPISAQGGSLNDFTTSVMPYDCEKVLSPINKVDFAITVSGDSMYPEYPSGCQVLIKKINERAFIDWGRVYVLDTCNGIVIKKLMPTQDPNILLCVSINKEYPPFEINLEHIYNIYRVLMCMSLK